MSRKKLNIKKKIIHDAKFSNPIIGKFINYLMKNGKKCAAENIAYSAIHTLGKTLKQDPVLAFENVVHLIKPLVEIRSRRVGGSTYQIPIEVRPERQIFKSLNWLIQAAKKRKSSLTMPKKMSDELIDAHNKSGGAFKKREETHKMAESNKAFSHFRY